MRKLVLSGLVALVGISGCSNKPQSEISYGDLNNDGFNDISILDVNAKRNFALIKKPDGSYEKTTIVTDNGMPFYYGDSGIYSPSGQFIKFNAQERHIAQHYLRSRFGDYDF